MIMKVIKIKLCSGAVGQLYNLCEVKPEVDIGDPIETIWKLKPLTSWWNISCVKL